MKEFFFVIGMSKFGASIADILSENGKDIIAVDIDSDAFLKLDDNFGGMKLVGDARDIEFLEEAGVRQATCFIASTDDDNLNMFLANVADIIFKVPNIFVRLIKDGQEAVLNSDRITPIHPFKLSVKEFIKSYNEDRREEEKKWQS